MRSYSPCGPCHAVKKMNGIGLTHWNEALIMTGLWIGVYLV